MLINLRTSTVQNGRLVGTKTDNTFVHTRLLSTQFRTYFRLSRLIYLEKGNFNLKEIPKKITCQGTIVCPDYHLKSVDM